MAGGIPTYRRQLRAPGVPNEAKATGDDYSSITHAADGLVQLEQAIANSRAQDQLSDGRLEAMRGMNAIEEKLDRDPDYANHESKWKAEAADLKNRISAGMSPRVTKRFDRSYDGVAETHRFRVKKNAFRQENGVELAKLDERLIEYRTRASQEKDDVKRKEIMDLAARDIAGAVNTGRLKGGLGIARTNQFLRDVRAGKWEYRAVKNPRAVFDASGRNGVMRSPPKGRKLPRGVRNNNPGNIEYGKFARTKGASGTDGRFARFGSAAQGIAAMGSLLRTYQSKYGLNTVRKMINRWAPPVENNTGGYAARVAKYAGVSPDQAVDMRDPGQAAVVIHAMIGVENGYDPYRKGYIQSALSGKGVPAVDADFAKLPLANQRRTLSIARATINKEETALNAEHSIVEKDFTQIVKLFEGGLPPREDMVSTVLAEADRLGMPDMADRLRVVQEESLHMRNLMASGHEDANREVEILQDKIKLEGATPELADKLTRYENLRETIKDTLKRNPNELAEKAGRVDFNPPPDGSDPAAMGKWFRNRLGKALAVSRQYGSAVRITLDHEVPIFAERYRKANPDKKAAMASAIYQHLGEYGDEFLAEIGRDGARTEAHLGSLVMRGGKRAASDGFIGLAMMAEDVSAPGTKADFEPAISATLGNALDPGRFAAYRSDIIKSAKAIYTARAAREGKTGFDKELYAQALNEAAGGFEGSDGEIRGGIGAEPYGGEQKIMLPSGMSEEEFELAAKSLEDKDLKTLSYGAGAEEGGGRPVIRTPKGNIEAVSALVFKSGRLETEAPGIYRIWIWSGSYSGYAMDRTTGGYYRIRLDDPALTKRSLPAPAFPEGSKHNLNPLTNFDENGNWLDPATQPGVQ